MAGAGVFLNRPRKAFTSGASLSKHSSARVVLMLPSGEVDFV